MARRRWTAAPVGLVVALIPISALAAGSWTTVPSPNVNVEKTNQLQATTAIGPSDVWAVGFADAGPAYQTVAEHWDGSAWTRVVSANTDPTQYNLLYGVAAVSSSDVWAVGFHQSGQFFGGASQTLVEHWDGSAWSIFPSPNTSTNADNQLNAVYAVSSNDVWAVGNAESGSGHVTLIEHWNGTTWSIATSPNVPATTDDELNGVAAVSSSDVWAVGFSAGSPKHTLTEHWNGSVWSIVVSANRGGSDNSLAAVTAVSSSDVWAVGYNLGAGGAHQTLAEHWNGAAWSTFASPNSGPSTDNRFTDVAKVSTNDVWAVGYNSTGGTGNDQTLTEHWNGAAWSIAASANSNPAQENDLLGVAVANTSNVWAVGNFNDGQDQLLAEQYNGVAWIGNSPSSATGPNGNKLQSVTSIAANDAWAVGEYLTAAGAAQTLTEHWDGSAWTVVASPNAVSSTADDLLSVTAVSTSDVYAVGWYVSAAGKYQPLVEHWDGTLWSLVTPSVNPAVNQYFQSVTAISSTDVWAVGYATGAGGVDATLAERWDGTTWSVVGTPNTSAAQSNRLSAVTAITSTDVWAVGYYAGASAQQTLVEHFNGTSWSIVASANTAANAQNQLFAVSAIGPSDIWAVGSASFQTLTEHWNGSAWSVVASANNGGFSNQLIGVSAVATNDVWAVGYSGFGFFGNQTLAEHWDGVAWTIASSANVGSSVANQLLAVDMTSSGSGWAVGTYGWFNGSDTLVEQYSLGACTGGSLSILDPGAQNFPALVLSGVDQTESVTVNLQPSDLTGSGAGWSIDATASQFTSGAHTLPASAASVTAVGVPSVLPGNCSLPSNSVAYPVPLGTTAAKIYDAAVNTGEGPSSVPVTFTLNVPSQTYAGTYTSNWVFSIVSGP